MRGLQRLAAGLLCSTLFSAVTAQGITAIHEPGRCAIRGHCGKKSIFGGELPCPDNELARDPDDAVREKLVSLCGSKWSEGPVCCEEEQVNIISHIFGWLTDKPRLNRSTP